MFAVAPLGAGIVDTTAGSALVTSYFTGQELKHMLEFLLVDNPTHPGEIFPRSSGMRFRYDTSRPMFDVVTSIEIGDLDRGYRAIDISGKDERLYSLTCPLMSRQDRRGHPKLHEGQTGSGSQEQGGAAPQVEKTEALDDPREGHARPPSPHRARWIRAVSLPRQREDAGREIKEWQAIMDYLRSLPVRTTGGLPTIPGQ